MRARTRFVLVLFHVGGGPEVSKDLFLLLWHVSLGCLYGGPETRTPPVLNAVFVPQMWIFDVELAYGLVMSHR